MNHSLASRHAQARRLLCGVAALSAACSVYEDGLVGADAAANGGAGAGPSNAGGQNGAGALHAGATSGGSGPGDAGGTSNQSASMGGSVSPDAGQAGAQSSAVAGESSDGGIPNVIYEREMLDDMEDGNAFVLDTDERNGHWDVGNDGTATAAQAPPAAHFVMAELLDAARPDSHFAAYTQGGGFKSWGATMTVSMITWPSYVETPTYDASVYAGISFYAKAGASSDLGLRIRFVGAQTDDRGQQCTPGGDVTTACYDHFFEDVELSREWQRFDLLFADFKQAGVGKKFSRIDVGTMYALEFFFPGRASAAGNAFEIWVDDLAFLLK